MDTDLDDIAKGIESALLTAVDNALREALAGHLGRVPSDDEVARDCTKVKQPNGHTYIFWQDQPVFAVTRTEWEVRDDYTVDINFKTCAIPPEHKPSTPKPMNSEIQRLTNLRNFFIAKREACEEEIRLQESQVKLWRESEAEVNNSIAQAEKEQAKASPTACGICKQPNCICNQAAQEKIDLGLTRCTKCGCIYPTAQPCHCQKTRPA